MPAPSKLELPATATSSFSTGLNFDVLIVGSDLLELLNLVQVADLIVRSARARQESRGLHFSRDYPALAAVAEATVLTPKN
jgi:aspartate oxidase